MSKPFVFKQFTIHQDQCAMKIGTDAVLLGAWINIDDNPFSVLDVGAGTGIIALMLAQRSNSVPIAIGILDAIEIDEYAYEQCVHNFENSPWGDRLFCYHASLEEFANEIDDTYNLIVSNPPFYSPTLSSTSLPKGENKMSHSRKLARFYDAMPFNYLIDCVSKLLSGDGKFSVIIPFKEETHFIDLALGVNLFPNRILRIKGTPNSEIKRSLIEFSFHENKTKVNELVIETDRHQYTQDYINLTKNFYLKM